MAELALAQAKRQSFRALAQALLTARRSNQARPQQLNMFAHMRWAELHYHIRFVCAMLPYILFACSVWLAQQISRVQRDIHLFANCRFDHNCVHIALMLSIFAHMLL